MTALLCLFLLAQTMEKDDSYFLLEQIEVSLPNGTTSVQDREIWIGRDQVRINQDQLSLLYDFDLSVLYTLDHTEKFYYLALAGREKGLMRNSLLGIAAFSDGLLEKAGPLVIETGAKKRIAGYLCHEYRLNYPGNYGVTTTIWCTRQPLVMNRNVFRKLWLASAGTSPPRDLRNIINHLLRELNGLPVRIVSTITQEELVISTTSTITHIEFHHQVEPNFFKVPQDYQTATIPRRTKRND